MFRDVVILERNFALFENERMSCTRVVEILLRRHLPNHCHMVVRGDHSNPPAFGEFIERPRVYFLGGRRDIYRHASDDEFEGEALDLSATVQSMPRLS